MLIKALPAVRAGRIMVVDDDRHIAHLLDFVLRKAGYEPFVASTAEKALAAIEACRPDAVLLDLNLPGMTGMDFLRTIRAKSGFSSCAVIVLSGHGLEYSDTVLAEAGANAQCSKPIAPSTLLRKLRDLNINPSMPKED